MVTPQVRNKQNINTCYQNEPSAASPHPKPTCIRQLLRNGPWVLLLREKFARHAPFQHLPCRPHPFPKHPLPHARHQHLRSTTLNIHPPLLRPLPHHLKHPLDTQADPARWQLAPTRPQTPYQVIVTPPTAYAT